jgi:hypothetical protein
MIVSVYMMGSLSSWGLIITMGNTFEEGNGPSLGNEVCERYLAEYE